MSAALDLAAEHMAVLTAKPRKTPSRLPPIGTLYMATAEQIEAFAQELVAKPGDPTPIPLNVIRFWPDGMPARLEHVWKDLVGFIPNYKLYDLQRTLAEFGFRMEIYEEKQ